MEAATRRGVRLELLTIAWMLVESVVGIGAGVAAHSVLLIAFGFDSVVELLSGIVVLRRLQGRAVESVTSRISAVLLVALCAYVVLSSVAGLALGVMPEVSVVGLATCAVAVVAMPLLARAKARVNAVLDSPSLRADIAESVSCAYLAATALAGLAVSMATGWWWAQYVAAAGLLVWLVPEVREAFGGGE